MTDKALSAIRPDMVRGLEWRAETPYHVARVFGNVYAVEGHDDGATLSGIGGRRELSSVAEAKAAAQADYASRILSALSPAFIERTGALEAENASLREELTPSAETKAAYIGEFSFREAAEEIALRMPDLIDGCDCPGCMESAAFIIAEALQAERERGEVWARNAYEAGRNSILRPGSTDAGED